ncbi:MAG: hypothetical protein AAF703_07720 [Cyanobacteria bacterium P01_D01_bin.105]
MSEHRLSNDLSPTLEAVLNGLNVNLEAELNRYRRTRHIHNAPEDDIFADLDAVIEASSDLSLDLSAAQSSMAVPAVVATASPSPPPLPRNKKLIAANSGTQADIHQSETHLAGPKVIAHHTALAPQLQHKTSLAALPATASSEAEWVNNEAHRRALNASLKADGSLEADGENHISVLNALPAKTALNSGYSAASEKLIDTLAASVTVPEPVNLNLKPKRKTISLMAGAALGFFALLAGLGASYVMSNPDMAQTLARRFNGNDTTTNALPEHPFDPPGPDLSAQEFVNLKLDNLSSLDMQSSLDPLATSATPLPPVLPPIEGATPSSVQSTLPQSTLPAGPATETQALSIPVGTNYYVTVPFSTEQGLIEIRKAVEEAFVRQFSDGNRIQLAVYNTPEAAQSFIVKLQTKGISAQIYGPTAE